MAEYEVTDRERLAAHERMSTYVPRLVAEILSEGS